MEPEAVHYNDRQSALIIRRALEMQRAERQGGAELSLDDLEAIGRESGIEPAFIRRAADELAAAEFAAGGRAVRLFLGRPVRSCVALPAARATQRTLEELLVSLASITGDPGSGSVVGSSLLWHSDAAVAVRSGRGLSVTVRPAGNATELRVESNLGGTAGGLFGGLLGGIGCGGGLGIGLGVGLGALASPLFAALVPICFLAASWLLARGIFSLVSGYRRKRDAQIAESIRRLLDRGGTTGDEASKT